MARIFITGSSDGLGSVVAQRLVARGHTVVLHARNPQRGQDAQGACPGASDVILGDLSSLAETKRIAETANKHGAFDCVIHNAGLYHGGYRKTGDGIPALAAVNTIAPYVLTALMTKPKRLVFLSSEMHQSGSASMDDVLWTQRREGGFGDTPAYSASKLHNILLAKAFARRWPDVKSNAMDPGWVVTKMGGSSAPDSTDAAVETYVMLAEGEQDSAGKTGRYFRPGKKEGSPRKETEDEGLQNKLLEICAEFSGVKLD